MALVLGGGGGVELYLLDGGFSEEMSQTTCTEVALQNVTWQISSLSKTLVHVFPSETGLTLLLKKKKNSPPSPRSAVKIILDCLVSESWTISRFATCNVGLT